MTFSWLFKEKWHGKHQNQSQKNVRYFRLPFVMYTVRNALMIKKKIIVSLDPFKSCKEGTVSGKKKKNFVKYMDFHLVHV